MLLYWVYKKDDGDFELKSFEGIAEREQAAMFHKTPQEALDSYRQHLEIQITNHTRAIRFTKEDLAKLNGLEEVFLEEESEYNAALFGWYAL